MSEKTEKRMKSIESKIDLLIGNFIMLNECGKRLALDMSTLGAMTLKKDQKFKSCFDALDAKIREAGPDNCDTANVIEMAKEILKEEDGRNE